MTKKKVQVRMDKTEWQVIENAHQSIIDKDLFYQAQRILTSKGHKRAPKEPIIL
jgi:site-specific DNA recombinase